ncbi:MAG: tripartite tricarboxylate transporter substrate binding protein [Pseudomonadota bacterium]
MRINKYLSCALLLASACGLVSGSHAQTAAPYPDKPIHIVVPYGAGGGPDVLARVVGQQIAASLKQAVVIDNKPGANGIIAAQMVAKAANDGYTLFVADTGHLAINPALYSKLPYDPVSDFATISLATLTPLFLLVNSKLPVTNFAQFLEYARKNSGKMSYGSSGNGSPHHLAMELFKSMARLDIAHIPYKGVAESVPALLGGQIDVMFAALPSVASSIQAGRLRVLAVSTSQRSSLMPEVPTVAEAGLAGYEMVSRIGFLAPAGTPKDRLDRLNADINQALINPEIARKLPSLGMELIGSSPQAYAEVIRSDKAKFQKIVSTIGIKID